MNPTTERPDRELLAKAAAQAGLDPDRVMEQLDRGAFDQALRKLNPHGSEMIAEVLQSPDAMHSCSGSPGPGAAAGSLPEVNAMALGNLLDTAEGRAELRELISAVRQEDPDGEAARYRRLRQALRELLASQTPELRLLEAAAAVLPAEKQSRLADARAIWALGNLLDLMRELELLPDEGEE